MHRATEIAVSPKIAFPVKDGALAPSDPLERACQNTEWKTVIGAEQDDLARAPVDLDYENGSDPPGAGEDVARADLRDECVLRGRAT